VNFNAAKDAGEVEKFLTFWCQIFSGCCSPFTICGDACPPCIPKFFKIGWIFTEL